MAIGVLRRARDSPTTGGLQRYWRSWWGSGMDISHPVQYQARMVRFKIVTLPWQSVSFEDCGGHAAVSALTRPLPSAARDLRIRIRMPMLILDPIHSLSLLAYDGPGPHVRRLPTHLTATPLQVLPARPLATVRSSLQSRVALLLTRQLMRREEASPG